MHLRLSEFECRESPLNALLAAAGTDRCRLAGALWPLVQLEASWSAGRVVLSAVSSNIGTVRIGELRIDVMPRMAAGDMATFISYALGGPPQVWNRSSVGDDKVGLDELICSVFADELMRLRQIGLSRLYVNRRESLPVLRGRPDFIASFPWNDNGMAALTCRYHELTCDNLDNQILRAALERATLMEVTIATRRKLMDHRQVWSQIASLRQLGPEDFVAARSRYTRLSEHYRLSHNLCELILGGRRPAALFDAGSVPTGGIHVSMAHLFELFVQRLLTQCMAPKGLTVKAQAIDSGALLDRYGEKYKQIRPDLVIYARGQPVAVLDAKYKDYWKALADGQPEKRISNEDLYQLFFYAQRLQMRHQLPGPPPCFIIAPLPDEAERDAQVLSRQFTGISWQAGGASPCQLDLLLLPLTAILRQMASGRQSSPSPSWLEPLTRAVAAY